MATPHRRTATIVTLLAAAGPALSAATPAAAAARQNLMVNASWDVKSVYGSATSECKHLNSGTDGLLLARDFTVDTDLDNSWANMR